VARRRKQRLRVGDLDDLAEIHDRDAIGHLPYDAEVVRDEEISEAQPLLELHQQIDDLRLDRHVEGRDRLVADDEVWLERQRPGDADSLPLAARELVRMPTDMLPREADEVEKFCDPCAPGGGVADAMDHERLGDDVADRHPRVQRAERILENDLHLPPLATHGLRRQAGQVLAAMQHLARRRLDEPQQQAAGGRLAATGFADEREGLSGADRQRDAVDRPHHRPGAEGVTGGEMLAERARLDEGLVPAHGAPAPADAWRTQATLRCSASRTVGGTAAPQAAVAFAQRGAKRQPGGMAAGCGTAPGMACNGRRGPSITGIEATNPCV
jgi:hypothetical protein